MTSLFPLAGFCGATGVQSRPQNLSLDLTAPPQGATHPLQASFPSFKLGGGPTSSCWQ